MRDFILADNQELTRLGLKTLLSEYSENNVTIVEDKAALIERLRHDGHTVVVIDNIFNQVDRRIYWSNRRYANFSSGTAVVFQTKVRF